MQAKVLFIGAGLLLAAGTAFADDPPAAGGGAGGEAAGAGSGSGSAAPATADATAAAGASVGWPAEIGSRPYTLPTGGIAAYGDVDIMTITSTSPMGMSTSFTQEQLHIGGAYGINDKLSVGAEFSFPLAGDGTDNTKFKGPLRFYGLYQLTHTDKMDVTAAADFELNLCGGVDMMGNCATTKAIGAGLDLKYTVAPKFNVFTGSGFGPGVPSGLGGIVFPGLGAFGIGNHLAISLESKGPITFSVPVGASYQASPQLFAYLSTELLSFAISNSPYADTSGMAGATKSVVFIGDDNLQIPINLGGFYSLNKNLDVGLNIFDNLKHPGDVYVLALAARWYK
jgi:hypothetical protein